MFDGLKDFLDLIRNDRTRVIIRLICGILIASQFAKLNNMKIADFIPSWALDALNVLAIPAVWFFSLFLVIVAMGIIGFVYRIIKKKSMYSIPAIREIEASIAILIAVVAMFINETIPRIFAIGGLIVFLCFDVLMQYRRMKKAQPSSTLLT